MFSELYGAAIMNIPPSSHFSTIGLDDVFNATQDNLTRTLQPHAETADLFGSHSFQGMPFECGSKSQNNVLYLKDKEVRIDVDNITATYLIFLHVVEDKSTSINNKDLDDFEGGTQIAWPIDGNSLGQLVSEYTIVYDDGSIAKTPIFRRFAIQQRHIAWGASPFAAVTALKPMVVRSASEQQVLGRLMEADYGSSEKRNNTARDYCKENLWLYAMQNPNPGRSINHIIVTPKEEQSLIYAISYTQVEVHPLRPGVRKKLKLTLPEGAKLNILGELEGVDIDLGVVISARSLLEYNRDQWLGKEPDIQPVRSDRAVVVEYIAHPKAKLYVSTGPKNDFRVYDLEEDDSGQIITVKPSHRPVRIRIVEKESKHPVAARLHLHGQAGEHLPTKGHHRKVNASWFEDNYGEYINNMNQYCYVRGECIVDLPMGEVFIEIRRGYEIAPVRSSFTVTSSTDEITFELDRVLRWREQGWVTADTHVHFLHPQTALLEGTAEGINIVNLLASQWGEMFSNVCDFDGKTTIGAKEFGGTGEFLVRVGTENRMQTLGHISLLGYSGSMIMPLATGGPSESAIGDSLEVTMAEWAQRCIDQSGLVIMPHAPNPQAEGAADIVLGLVHAIEMMTFNPYDAQINPYGLADWYRFLNLGYHIPVVGGSDKMSAGSLLGGIRTYTNIGKKQLSYENWMSAVKSGNTFVTVGPLAELLVEGLSSGSQLKLPETGGTVNISWKVESVSVPIDRVEIVIGGLTAEKINVDQNLSAFGSIDIPINESCWIALRVRGSYYGKHGEIAAHTSAVQIIVGEKPILSQADGIAVLEQIEGAIAYVDTIAPRPDALRFKQLRATLETAHNRLHQKMHRSGIYHRHTPLHDSSHSNEH